LAKYDLSSAKFNILLIVKHIGKEKGIAQNEISKQLLVTTSNITRMIDKLEKDKLVVRIALPGDRRVKLIQITKKGSDLLDKVWIPYKKTVDEMVGQAIIEKDKQQINAILEKFSKNLKEA